MIEEVGDRECEQKLAAAGASRTEAPTGRWLYSGSSAILHIVGGHPQGDLRPGVIDHMAFSAVGLSDTLANLAAHGIEHTCRRQAGAGPWQVFFFDPNGARVELDFSPDEIAPLGRPDARSASPSGAA